MKTNIVHNLLESAGQTLHENNVTGGKTVTLIEQGFNI